MALISVALFTVAPAFAMSDLVITSPRANEDLSGLRRVNITWESYLADSSTYSVYYSSDGVTFNEKIASELTAPEFVWEPGERAELRGWIKVRTYGSTGKPIAESVVAVRFLPRTAVVVSKANQKVFYFEDGALKDVFTCSTALPKYDIKEGRYKVYSREEKHWSREYEVWMPHSLFFHEGYALHATLVVRLLGRPASHGCVRLSPKDAESLYNEVSVGTPVIVLPKTRDCSNLIPAREQKAPPAKDVLTANR